MSHFVPPPRRRPPQVDAAEFLALRTIVMSLVATIASLREASGSGTAQDWINHISACCQEALLAADVGDGGDPERLRREAMEHINHILGGVGFPTDRDNSN
jgi:hypothetical protein